MNAKLKTIVTLSVIAAAITSTGCNASLPWRKRQVAQTPKMTAAQYAQQAASNIEYNTPVVDVSQDYQPSARPSPSYTSPPPISSASSSGGGGSCCH